MTPQCDSKESFIERTWLVGPTDDFEPAGIKASLLVPAGALTRHLWIACGAHYQFNKSDHWFIQGRLKFYLEDTQVGVLEFSDASSELSASERAKGKRSVMRIAADANGSTQPSLRYQTFDTPGSTWVLTPDGGGGFTAAEDNTGVAHRENLDIPCITVNVACDKIEYELEKCYAASSGAFLFGFRVVSTQ